MSQVYMSSSGLDWRPLLSAWLLKRPQGEVEIFKTCFEESFAPIYQWTRQNTHYVMEVLEFNVINQVMLISTLARSIDGKDQICISIQDAGVARGPDPRRGQRRVQRVRSADPGGYSRRSGNQRAGTSARGPRFGPRFERCPSRFQIARLNHGEGALFQPSRTLSRT